MGFKIADAYVAVDPKDDDASFELGLRRIVEDAAAKVEARVGARLRDDAPGSLREDLDVALELVTDRLDANVGLGLHNDAVGDLDADVKAGVKLVGEKNKVKVGVDEKAAKDAGMSLGAKILVGVGAVLGPGVLTEAVLAGVPLMITALGAALVASDPQVKAALAPLTADVSAVMVSATRPLVPAAAESLRQLDSLFAGEVPRLAGYFRQAQPDLLILTGGVEDFVRNVLPGFDAGMAQGETAAQGFATGMGLAGEGISRLIEGLSGGAQGGAQGFVATMRLIDDLLGILGTDLGRLATAAGPVLEKAEPALAAVAADLTGATSSAVITGLDLVNSILSALPVDVVRALADATAAWYAASRVYNVVAAAGPLLVGAATKVKLLSAAEIEAAGGADALGASWGKTLGTLGLVLAGAGLLGNELGKLSGVGDHTSADVDRLTASLSDAAGGSIAAQKQVTEFADAMAYMSNVSGGKAVDGMKSLDQALAQLYQTSPAQAAEQFTTLSRSLEAQGTSAQQAANYFPAYTKAVEDAKLQQKLAVSSSGDLTAALDIEKQRLDDVVGSYGEASDAASHFKTVQDALYGKYADYSAAQANFTERLSNATGQLTRSRDAINLHSDAGAKNFTVLKGLYDANEQLTDALIKQGGSQSDATRSVQQGAQAIDDLARKSGFTDKQIRQLNIDLYGVPTVKEITFRANTGPASQAVKHLLNEINASYGTIQVYANVHNPAGGKALGFNAAGGPVQRGDVSVVGEEGPEIVVFGAAGRVIPNDQIRTVGGTSSNALAASLGMTIHNLTIPITMNGLADFSDPNNLSAAAYQLATDINNALIQINRARTGVPR